MDKDTPLLVALGAAQLAAEAIILSRKEKRLEQENKRLKEKDKKQKDEIAALKRDLAKERNKRREAQRRQARFA
ncbi:hypothetical protein PG984_011436 [Apiospora sp. TS-2023a]